MLTTSLKFTQVTTHSGSKGQTIAKGRTSEANAYASEKVVEAAPKSVITEVGGSASGGGIVSGSVQGNAGAILPLRNL